MAASNHEPRGQGKSGPSGWRTGASPHGVSLMDDRGRRLQDRGRDGFQGRAGRRGASLRPAAAARVLGARTDRHGRSADEPHHEAPHPPPDRRARRVARSPSMTTSVLVLGAGFGGLELSTRLSEELGDRRRRDADRPRGRVRVRLLEARRDVRDARRRTRSASATRDITTPHVRFRQETVTVDRPGGAARRDRPRRVRGRRAGGGARRRLRPRGDARAGRGRQRVLLGRRRRGVRDVLPSFRAGTAIVGVCGPPFKCPPAPSEAALLLDDYLRERGVRDDVRDPGRDAVRRADPAVARHVRRRSSRGSPSAASSSCPDTVVASLDPARTRPCSTTARGCRSTCSSASRCIARRRSSSTSGHDARTAGSRWTRRRSRPGSPACTPSAT